MTTDNMNIWEQSCKPDPKALNKIGGGRLKGMTDINPIWRIRELTKHFGMCGVGWWTVIDDKSIFEGAGGEIIASVDVSLYVIIDGEPSAPISGTGGSMLVAKEKGGLHTSDEAFKMAETDAISVCCKKLGFAADIYWEKGASDSKYQRQNVAAPPANKDVVNQGDIVNSIIKLGGMCETLEGLGELWQNNKDDIAKLPEGMKRDLTLWKDERKEELAKA